MTGALLEISDVAANYGGVQALRGVSLTVARGEVVALIGANGSGKSTLARVLSGLVQKSAGRVVFDGNDVSRLSAPRIVQNGLVHVPEGREIFASMTVEENLLIGGYRFGRPRPSALSDVLTLFPRLKERLKQRSGTLSGGEQQMLAIARGLLTEPKLLVLDEPSLGLAPIVVELLYRTFGALKARGMSMLVAEQNTRRVLALSDRAYVLSNGRIALSGNSADLGKSESVLATYLGSKRDNQLAH